MADGVILEFSLNTYVCPSSVRLACHSSHVILVQNGEC